MKLHFLISPRTALTSLAWLAMACGNTANDSQGAEGGRSGQAGSNGSAGAGSMTHLVAEMLKLQAGIDMTHVLYRGGTPAMNDVLAGQIPMTFGTVVQGLPQYEGGLLRALAVTSEQRYPAIPKVPTFKEQGIDLRRDKLALLGQVVVLPGALGLGIVFGENARGLGGCG